MDFVSVIRNELFKPLAINIVPGLFALSPWLLVIMQVEPWFASSWSTNSNAFTGYVLAGSIAAGLILEDIGSRIESYWDRRRKRKHKHSSDEWGRYLRLRVGDECVGQRYLRAQVTRMKFELSFAPALISALLGLCVYHHLSHKIPCGTVMIIVFVGAVLVIYLIKESHDSSALMARARQQIISSMEHKDSE